MSNVSTAVLHYVDVSLLILFTLWSLQHWMVFKEVTEVFILVPALLGLKGNLEMTLASRLSTAVRNLHVGEACSLLFSHRSLHLWDIDWKSTVPRSTEPSVSLANQSNLSCELWFAQSIQSVVVEVIKWHQCYFKSSRFCFVSIKEITILCINARLPKCELRELFQSISVV